MYYIWNGMLSVSRKEKAQHIYNIPSRKLQKFVRKFISKNLIQLFTVTLSIQ